MRGRGEQWKEVLSVEALPAPILTASFPAIIIAFGWLAAYIASLHRLSVSHQWRNGVISLNESWLSSCRESRRRLTISENIRRLAGCVENGDLKYQSDIIYVLEMASLTAAWREAKAGTHSPAPALHLFSTLL